MVTVSFHSYKGGSCRTSTCYNTIPFLVNELGATPEKPLLVVDADLESQGLTYLLNVESLYRSNQMSYDAKELFSGTAMQDYRRQCIPVGDRFGLDNELVYFLGINDSKDFVAQNSGGQLQIALSRLYGEKLCGIVFDTASGDQLSASATNRVSNVIVCCMRPTKQFRMGTFSFLGRIGHKWIKEGGEQVRRVIVLPTAVPNEHIEIDGKDQHSEAIEKINYQFNQVNFEISDEFVSEENFGIPEVKRFKWCEDCLYRLKADGKLGNEEDSELALTRYEQLAKVIISESEKVDE